jgi:hypothetical protein
VDLVKGPSPPPHVLIGAILQSRKAVGPTINAFIHDMQTKVRQLLETEKYTRGPITQGVAALGCTTPGQCLVPLRQRRLRFTYNIEPNRIRLQFSMMGYDSRLNTNSRSEFIPARSGA